MIDADEVHFYRITTNLGSEDMKEKDLLRYIIHMRNLQTELIKLMRKINIDDKSDIAKIVELRNINNREIRNLRRLKSCR